MSHKINEQAVLINKAYGLDVSAVDAIADKLADICTMTQEAQAQVGFVAKKVQEIFTKDELEIIATMFISKVINEENGAPDEDCPCPGCRATRGESVEDDEIVSAIKKSLEGKFPGMEAKIIKVPLNSKRRTDC